MKKSLLFLSPLLFFTTLILFVVPKAHAISCSPNPGGGYTISSSCTFPYTVDGVESGDMVINPGATLTINAGQTVVYNPGNKLTINGAMAISATGKAYQGFIYVKDADTDGYPDDNTSYSLTQTDGTWLRRYTMTSLSSSDCDTATANFQSIASLEADADSDGYTSGSSATRCVGGTSTINGRTYYRDAATASYKWLSTGARLGTSDCNDASATVWRNRYADADADGYGTGSVVCLGNEAGYVDNGTDCDDTINTKWQNLSCYTDVDNDTYTAGGPYTVCKGSACNSPTGHQSSASGSDCSDSNAYIYQNVSVYTDSDQDGYISAGPASTCVGSTSVVNGRTYYKNSAGVYPYIASTLGSDCYDSNANAYPGNAYYSSVHRGDGSFDFNCDGTTTNYMGSNTNCSTTISGPYSCTASKPAGLGGLAPGNSFPTCGNYSNWRICWNDQTGGACTGGYGEFCGACANVSKWWVNDSGFWQLCY